MFHVGIDIGGTFTDCAVMDERGRIACIAKSPSNREDPSEGVLAALQAAAGELSLDLGRLLADTRLLIHGCTVATNAMVERKGACTGLITTRGHEDAILIGNVIQKVAGLSERDILHQSRLSKARPLVEPERIAGVRERVDAAGEVVAPLVPSDVEEAADRLVQQGVTSIAISFLWSFRNGQHERVAEDIVHCRHPELSTVRSSEVAPVLGEYERTVTTVLSAYLGPSVVNYLQKLAARLKQAGYPRELLVSHCMGGLTTLAEAQQRPLLTLDSGPAGGVLGARHFGSLYGEPNVLCTDMGGTTFDVSLIEQGDFALDEQPVLDKYAFLVPKIAISSIGAGGGSLVWADDDGMLHVGPQSAGAQPGPASYGRGGTQPTVTDVDLFLGYLDPSRFLGGRQPLRPDLARQAIASVARQAGMDELEVAAGAFRIVNAHMADLIRQTTVEKGHDPRQFVLFAYGGAAPAHAAYYGRELQMKRVYVPRYSTVFSALGMLTGGILHSAEASHLAPLPLSEAAQASVCELLASLERRLADQFEQEGHRARAHFRRFAYLKYSLQFRPVAVPLPDELSLDDLAERFEDHYARVYGQGAGYRQAGIELVKLRVDGFQDSATHELAADDVAPEPDPSPALRAERQAFFIDLQRYVATPVYDGDRLQFGNVLTGPCIVERMGDTIVVPPGIRAEVDRFRSLIFDMGERS